VDGTDALRAQGASKQQKHLHSESSYKRLERGRFPQIARLRAGELELSELLMWLDGVDVSRVSRLAPVAISRVA